MADPTPCYFEFGLFRADPMRRVLLRDSESVSITSKVFDTLLLLVENHGKLLTRDELLQRLWPDKIVEESGLTQNIAVLRKILGRALGTISTSSPSPAGATASCRPFARGRLQEHKRQLPISPQPAFGPATRIGECVVWVLLGFATGIVLALWLRSPTAPNLPLIRFAFTPGGDVLYAAVSPNGRHIAYVAQGKLWIQDLDRGGPRAFGASEGAQRPFWSPGSDFIAFSVGDELKKVAVTGGPAVSLSQRPSGNFVGGAWNPNGESIVFSVALRRLYQTPARGGEVSFVEDPRESQSPRRFWFPHFLLLDDGRQVLLLAGREGNESRIVARDLDSGTETVVGKGSLPVYSPGGHVLYQTSRSAPGIWALPFSAEMLTAAGEPFLVAERGRTPSVSADGTLVYLDSPGAGGRQLVWRDRKGQTVGRIGLPQESIPMPAVSPDESRVAVVGLENGNQDIWIHNLRRPEKTRLTFDGDADIRPTWSPSGKRLAFSSLRQRDWDIFIKRADGAGGVTPLVANSLVGLVTDWSRDEKFVLFQRDDTGASEAVPILQTPFAERAGKLSPDGRYVAYISDETGRHEIYVEEFPNCGGKSQVSTTGGVQPRWSRDGKELFYVEDGSLIAVSVTTKPNFLTGTRRKLFESAGLRVTPSHLPNYDVSADGRRFVIPERVESEAPTVIRVIRNWFSEF